jgi:translocation and assembly module TamB
MKRRTSLVAALIIVTAIAVAVMWTVNAASHRVREFVVAAASAALNREVSIGRVSGDPWRGVVLDDLRIAARPGRPAGEQTFTARRLTIIFDPLMLVRDVWQRRGPGASISQIIVDEPVVPLVRAADGHWNVEQLLPRGAASSGPGTFAGRVIVTDGTVVYADHERLKPNLFQTRFEDLNATADFSNPSRIRLRVSLVEARGDQRVPVRANGTYTTTTGDWDIDLEATEADAGVWGPYVVATPVFRVTGGRFDARIHVLRIRSGDRAAIDIHGRLALRRAQASIPDRRAFIADATGAITINNLSFSTERLTGTVNGSLLEARGDISFHGEPQLNVAVRSQAVDLAMLRRVLFPGAAVSLRGVASGEVRLVGPVSMPRIDGRVTAARGEIEQQPFAGASGDFAVYGQMVRIAGGRARAGEAAVEGDVWWSLDGADYVVRLRFDDADRAAIARWTPGQVPVFTGRADGAVTAARRGDALTVVGEASVDRTEVAGVALDRLETSFTVDPRGIRLDRLQARQADTSVFLRGRVDSAGRMTLSALARDVDLERLPGVPMTDMLGGRMAFSGAVTGSVDAPEVRGDALVAAGRFRDLRLDTARGHIVLQPGRLTLEDAAARSGRSRFGVAGQVTWGAATRMDLDVEAEQAPAAVLARWLEAPMPVTGRVDGRIRLFGLADRPAAAGHGVLRDADVAGQRIDEASAGFRWDGIRLTLDGGIARRRQSVIEASGLIDRRTGLNLEVSGRGIDLADIAFSTIGATRVEGRINFTGRIAGRALSPTLTATAGSSTLTINGRRFDDASGRLRWEDQILTFDEFALRLGSERYDISGDLALTASPTMTLRATVENGRLSTLLGLANVQLGLPLDATISGFATLDGPVANPGAHLDLRVGDGYFGAHKILDGRFDLTLRDGNVTIEEFFIRPPQGAIAARGTLNLRGESQAEISGSDLDLDLLRPFTRLTQPLLGRLTFATQLGGTLAAPEIGFALELTKAGIQGATFDSLVANAFYRDGELQVQQALLVQDGNKLRASGSAPFNPALLRFDEQREMDFRITLADVNLGLLRLLTTRIEQAVGAVEGEVRVTGSPASPHVAGGVQVRDGRVRVSGLQTPFENVRLDLRFDGNQIRIQEATATMGGGQARLDGAVRLVTVGSPGIALIATEDAPLVLRGTGLRIVYPPFADVRAEGQARIWGSLGDPRRPLTVDGQVTVSDGVVSIVETDDAGGPLDFPLVFRGVRLVAGRSLAVQMGGLRSDVAPGGSLLLGGTLQAPTLDGTVEAQQGKIAALGNVFDVRNATARFQPRQGIRPTVEARAETQVGTTRIYLNISGLAPDLTLDLRSDPDFSREEILALLGRQAGISRLLQGDVEGQLRASIGRYLFGRVTLPLGKAIGLTELTVDYDFEGALALRLGKLLFQDVYLTYSTILSQPPSWILALEYRFARNWQFTLSLDSLRRRDVIVWYTARF